MEFLLAFLVERDDKKRGPTYWLDRLQTPSEEIFNAAFYLDTFKTQELLM